MGNSKSKSTAPATLNGLYASCAWDSKTIRMLVASKRIAPLYPGATEETRVTPAGSTASDHSTPTVRARARASRSETSKSAIEFFFL